MNIFSKAISRLNTAKGSLRIGAAAILMGITHLAGAQTYSPLITDISQLEAPTYGLDAQMIEVDNPDSPQWTYPMTQQIEVNMSTNPVTLSSDKGLILYLGRYQYDGAPTLVKVEARKEKSADSTDPDTWITLGHAHFQYRGGATTHEFSSALYPNEADLSDDGAFTLDRLRLTVLKTAYPASDGADHYRLFKINLFTYNKGDLYPAGRKDPLRFGTDYYTYFKDYTYEPNSGILDPRNHYAPNDGYPSQTPWGENNTFLYDGEHHELPTFDKQGGGQMPHVTEQTLYAMPGDIISLSPYFDLPEQGNYREKFSHWYGYKPRNENHELQEQDYRHITDSEGNRLLDFLIDPSGIVLTDNAGYFGGSAFPRPAGDYVIRNYDDLVAFSTLVAQGNGYQNLNAILAADIDCGGANFNCIGRYNPDRNESYPYTGIFNGNGHTIRNLNVIQKPTDYNLGLFGLLGDGATIRDLDLIDVKVLGGGRAAALAGTVTGNVRIQNCLVTGSVEITSDQNRNNEKISYAGGIVGVATYGATVSMSDVAFIGSVKGGYGNEGSNGALVGYFENGATGTIENCYADASVGNIHLQNGMYNSFNPVRVNNSYTNVTSTEEIPAGGRPYLVHQSGFSNEYPADEDAYRSAPDAYEKAPESHYVRVYGIPDDPALWPTVYINCWGGNLDTGWPGIQLTKGDGYYYTVIPNRGVARMMVNNGNDGKDSDHVKGNAKAFSAEGDAAPEVDFGANDKDYRITFNGHLKELTIQELTESAAVDHIYVRKNDNWDGYALFMNNSAGATYTKIEADDEELRDGVEFVRFDLPSNEQFNRLGLKYTVLPYKGNIQGNPLLKAVADPMPARAKGTCRIFAKKPDGWDNMRAYVWSEGNLGEAFPGIEASGTVQFEDGDYLYYDVPAALGAWGGLNFTNGIGGDVDTQRQYKDAIVYYDGDMKVALTRVGESKADEEGSLNGGYFNPIYFEYDENAPVPEITFNGETYPTDQVSIGDKTYYYINFAPIHKNAGRLVVGEDKIDNRANPTVIGRSETVDIDAIWEEAGFVSPAQFYTTLPLDGNPSIYLQSKSFSDTIREGLTGWTTRHGALAPAQTSTEDVGETTLDISDKFMSHAALRWYGTEATFHQPYKTQFAPNAPQNLSLEQPEYHIAADFGHEFNAEGDDHNIDRSTKTIHEPIINFRHIFHVKDGKKFADDNTTSKPANEKYLSANSRAISARAGRDFQIRLTQQVPRFEEGNDFNYTKTNFYYKKGQDLYERVPRVGLKIFDEEMNPVADQSMFFFDAYTSTTGTRKYPMESDYGFAIRNNNNGADYHGGNAGGQVYRSLFCAGDKARQGTYIVRLQALDTFGNPIKIYNPDGEATDDLYLDQYVVTFLDDQSASVLTEARLYDDSVEGGNPYYTHRPGYLEQEEVCGAPAVVVDFDQYRTFEAAPYNPDDYFRHHNNQIDSSRSYKWPVLWQKSTYSFGYGGYYTYDFNEYLIANHSSEAMYHAAADTYSNPDGTPGLYDRLYYDTYFQNPENPQMGYFYYTNAASDPGVAARLNINSLCPGSTVGVSAWVAEMSYENEVANLSFNFVAVDGDGNREIVHSFVTGYIDNINYGSQQARYDQTGKTASSPAMADHGKWVHVYYSFIPDLSSVQNLTMIDHYELELENNCVSSIGADYAVDDIRAYIISPAITAQQLTPVCDAGQGKVGVRIRSRFEKLLSSNGLEETNSADLASDITLNFAVLDKKKYDDLYAAYIATDYDNDDARAAALNEVVRRSAIQVVDTEHADSDRAYYTPMTITTYYEGMPEYDERTLNTPMRYTSNSGTKYFQANLQPTDTDLRPGKDYYIVLYTQYSDMESPEAGGLGLFAVTDDPCAKYDVMTLQGSGVVKVDGIAYTDGAPIEVCEGQSPVVQVDLKMLNEGIDLAAELPAYSDYVNAPSHYYDWFAGPIEEFMASRDSEPSYFDLLYIFRNGKAPDGTSGPTGEGFIDADELPDPEENVDDIYAPLRALIAEGRLVLHASSYVFPPISYESEGDPIRVLTAMPVIPGPDDEAGYKVCSQPNEIRLRIRDNSPRMADGFAGIDYPESDVPLRVGLRQLRSVRQLGALTAAKTEFGPLGIIPNVEIGADMRRLELPLRGLLSYKGADEEAVMTMAGNRNEAADPYVYLVETNDPAYISLDKHPMDRYAIKNSLLPIGLVDDLSARTGQEANSVTILFDENMQFSEGYYYRVRFAFDEVIPTEVEGYCEGHVVFTIKVVPEYLKWTGADSRNWNNDSNWSRVTPDDILLGADDEKRADFTATVSRKRIALIEDADGVVEAKEKDVPSNRRAYAPLDFTKALVMKMDADTTAGYPWMFAARSENINTLRGPRAWNRSALPADATGISMKATDNIQYDMTALDLADTPLAVRPWYANTCEQIHFNHGAEMNHQEHFIFGTNYQKAWVDMEMTADRWYSVASPLQGVVAGDMYTMTARGRQENELFTDIRFDNAEYGRYEPAVYQRGWNKASASNYLLGDGTHAARSAAVELNWSRVYNDVDEDYAPGSGYSIRTSADGITSPLADEDGNAKVLFRLPKADDTYSYFDGDDKTEAADDTKVSRLGDRHALTAFDEQGRFTTTLSVGNSGNYFLAGNPFMARMNMARFLEANATVIEPAYWIMTSDRQEATLWDEKSGTFLSTALSDDTDAATGVVAPMQGFFVKAKTAGTTLTLTYTPAMAEEGAIDNTVLLRAPRREGPASTGALRLTALTTDGVVASRALLRLDAEATAAYAPGEDAPLLIDRTLEGCAAVYTADEGQALAINSLDAITETEVGIVADPDAEHTLLFEGVDEELHLKLLDTLTGEISDLREGKAVDVKSAATGRFYIIRQADSDEDAVEMAMVLKHRTVSVVAMTDGVMARVYTPDGMLAGEYSDSGNVLRFDLEPGIFIVEAEADGRRIIRKYVVR